MNDSQKYLMPYVEHRVFEIIFELEQQNKVPLISTLTEIMKPIREDVLECMRELHHSGKYRGTKTLNQPALIKEK